MIKYYNLKLKLKSGLLSELQSDTVWGHFCWRLKEIKGENILEEFLNLYSNNNPVFTISNSFLEYNTNIYFPYPDFPAQFKRTKRNKKNKIIDFLKYKRIKDVNLITLNELNHFLQGNFDEMKKSIEDRIIKECKVPKFENDLRVSVEIDREKLSSKEGQLFSYAPGYLNNDYIINIFIKVLSDDNFINLDCENIFKEVFNLGFGKKKSSGYGEFEVISFNEFKGFAEVKNANAFLNLSNYLPDDNDKINDAYYDFHLKYGKLGEDYAVSENPFKKPIIFIKEGSCFKVEKQRDFYGRCTNPGEISFFKEIIHYGLSFSLNLKT